jgi:hydrogenase expression/formation protein HypC
MCLAIPARVTSINENRMAEVDIMGVSRHVSLDLVPDAKEDDFVLVHAGFAIQIIDQEAALEALQMFKDLDILETEA